MSNPILPDGKACTKCAQFKSLTEYSPNKIGLFGVNPACKKCCSAMSRLYAERNKEALAARKKAYRASPEVKTAISEYNRAYADAHAATLREKRMARYAIRTTEMVATKRAADKKHRDKYKEEINARRRLRLRADHGQRSRAQMRSKAWYLRNAVLASQNAKMHYRLNRDKIKTRIAEYQRENPERTRMLHRVKAHTRRLRLRAAGGAFARQDIDRLLVLQKWQCANCRKSLRACYHIDHREPVARGGNNHRWNLELLCPKCNLAKSDKLPHEFAAENGRLI